MVSLRWKDCSRLQVLGSRLALAPLDALRAKWLCVRILGALHALILSSHDPALFELFFEQLDTLLVPFEHEFCTCASCLHVVQTFLSPLPCIHRATGVSLVHCQSR